MLSPNNVLRSMWSGNHKNRVVENRAIYVCDRRIVKKDRGSVVVSRSLLKKRTRGIA